jgi:hypothetical protein
MSSIHSSSTTSKVKTTPTFSDWIFILVLLSILSLVGIMGHDAYLQAMKTEVTKKNGEDLSAWLVKTGTERFKHQTDFTECMGGKPPVAEIDLDHTNINSLQQEPITVAVADTEASEVTHTMTAVTEDPKETAVEVFKPGTWGACFDYIMTKSELKDMLNPFTNEVPQFVAGCNPSDPHLPGSIVIEKLTPTPPGSAVPVINSQLVSTDSIDQKMQLRISVCDKGSYAIKIAEFEF